MKPEAGSGPAIRERSGLRLMPRGVIVALLGVGLLSSVAFRAIIIAEHTAPGWVRPLWYAAVLLNAAFFAYRYAVSRRRVKAVVAGELDRKLATGQALSDDERADAAAILYSIRISPERWNYLVIFVLSALAIAGDLWLSA